MADTRHRTPSGVTEDARLSRRSLLRASPALLAPGLLASTALASSSTDTAVLRLFREWDEAEARLNEPYDSLSEDDFEAAMSGLYALERRMRAEPSTCLTDLAAKVVASSCYGDFPVEEDVIGESITILGPLALRSEPKSRTRGIVLSAGEAGSPASSDSPVLALYREHEATVARYEGTPDGPESDAIYWTLRDLEDRMEATPACTAADLAMKVLVLTQVGDGIDTPNGPGLVAECEALVAEALA